MSAESPRHVRSGGPLTVPSQPPSDRGIIDAVSGFINDVTLSSSSTVDPKDVIQWARFETADINEPTPEGDSENDISPLLLILGYGSGVQVWLIPPTGEAQEVLSWRQGTVRVLRILPTPQHGDCFASKRPLIALCDSASPGPSFCSLSFISIRGGEQVKSIKFKNPILDVLANKSSVVVSFSERFAVFDAATLEDRMAVTTCYPCPCPLGGSLPINPLALGDRWLAYADKKLNQSKRSSGGCEGEGVTSYTATVLHAAKSLSKGLRGLGESVAHSLAGGRSTSQSPSPPNADIQQPGVVTIIDIEGADEEDGQDLEEPSNPIKAHFVAHSDAIIALKFDASGLLLVTADRRGHDFHVFRVNPHPCGPSLASVHHLYILHRGDTTAKVQDIAISPDSRWTAISTLRGTTHVFAISPYGGQCGVRTHTQPRVVNRLSRFHRSAGLPIHTTAAKRASGSPVTDGLSHGAWFPNPRLPPYPLPITAAPLAQLRPTANIPTHTITRNSSGRQRLSSLSEDSNAAPLLARARFGAAAGGQPGGLPRGPAAPVAALYLMAANGSLLHLLLHPRPLSSVPKEKICDESAIELEVEPVAQWPLQRPPAAADLLAPLPPSSPLLQQCSRYAATYRCADMCMSEEERWLSQVEIVTHAGPHRRLWMGPQFVFKTYNCTGSSSSLSEAEAVEVDAGGVARSNPVNVPAAPAASALPVLVDSGSASSLEHSPSDSFRRKSLLAETGRAASVCDVQLREDLAEAMKEDHGVSCEPAGRAARRLGGGGGGGGVGGGGGGVERAVDPLGTVVQPARARAPPADPEPELYVTSNCDEATFRPVLRAAAPLASRPEDAAQALPHTTTIPVQSLPAPAAAATASPDPQPLGTAVVIPAALTAWPPARTVEHNYLDKPSLVEDEREVKDARPSERARERSSATAERICEDPPQSLPRSNRPSDDIQPARPRVKRSPTPQSDSGRATDVSSKDRKSRIKPSVVDESSKSKVHEPNEPEIVKVEKIKHVEPDPAEPNAVVRSQKETPSVLCREKTSSNIPKEKTPPIVTPSVSLKGSVKNTTEVKSSKKKVEDDVKTEDQAWDMLVNEPEKPVVYSNQPLAVEKVNDEPKPKSKKNRKGKKSQDDAQAKAEEDTFIEIHAIEEKQQPSSGELVSISMPYEDLEPISYSAKAKKSRSSKSVTPERIDTDIREKKEQSSVSSDKEDKLSVSSDRKDCSISSDRKDKCSVSAAPKERSRVSSEREGKLNIGSEANDEFCAPYEMEDRFDYNDIWSLDEPEPIKTSKNNYDIKTKTVVPEYGIISKEINKEKQKPDKFKMSYDAVETTKDCPKAKKTKSLSPYSEHKSDKKQEPEVKDVYVIDTMTEEFPDITITKGSKLRKKSPQPAKQVEEKEVEVIEMPVKFVEKPVQSVEKPVRSVENPIKSVEKPVRSVENPIKSVEIPVRSVENPIKSVENPVKPVVNRVKSTERPVQTIEKPGKPIEKLVQSIEKPVKSVGNPIKSVVNPVKPIVNPIKSVEKPLQSIVKPVKSWSSIAASKNYKKDEKVTEEFEVEKKISKILDEPGSSTKVSLQEKLFELCKRTDIMVAECDAPSETLNFVEEHHSVHDLPSLEPFDFGLDDFKLEAMQDGLSDVDETSPICKINIDSILSTIKETTSKAIESSAFNLIDLEKVPTKTEKGFSVVENDKIKTLEVKIDEERDEKEGVMEKSSDDDITSPVVSTDSAKEDKKAGATNVTMPSSKQSSKSKKSRKKKK